MNTLLVSIGQDRQICLFLHGNFAGRHLQIYMGHPETRYYFSKAMEKWYVGANMGMAVYDMQKWNYWNTSLYQKGFNVMLGASVGYQLK